MIRLFTLFFVVAGLAACGNLELTEDRETLPSSLSVAELDTFPFASSIRALEVVNDSTVWFAGSGGVYGYTQDGGQNWYTDSLRWDSLQPHFRAIAVTDEAVFLLSIASPALLFRSTDRGQSWQLAYREDDPAAFYDAMTFWDEQHGIAMGDPTDGCLSVIITRDGGRTWRKVDCEDLPAAEEGEAAFAASNSNISVYGDHAWIVSGGARARVLHTPDRGQSWEVFDTPIREGGQMTGIYTVDFLDEQHGIIFGGDWNDKPNNSSNKAMTSDGGRTWQLIADGQEPGYRSCVRYAPGTDGQMILAAGIPGTSYSLNGGESWEKLNDQSFYTFRFGDSWRVVWLAGNGKVARLLISGRTT
ncbi:WD40/YVTN/BNR-like repeat-containing protein [Flavilitoribacter nigricans]|uniref:Oxidoreductase n=1 Tax=Flavilitoribacter nigricans (strain ATCC 23147 / DSM 23189 / NBRC 102662 / NCIMB 1420 / SS-2) TaxID=1122177 RepID=A0A2D0NFT3_FLAN2|nr:YCF48-related protein [Flavilitoribacter nigricans]PHN07345.1 oxidoreductase [Flavilitoribacter nigricans DSM 23189 = NBRC 102662]